MTDKNAAADALVAALRQKRQLRQDALQAGFREKTPDRDRSMVQKVEVRDNRDDGNNIPEELGDSVQEQESATSLIEDGGGDGDDGGRDQVSVVNGLKTAESIDGKKATQPEQSTVRERMRQKMLARRERPQTTDGENSEREGAKSLSMTSRRLRGLRDAKTTSRTRFDGAETRDDEELEQELAAR